MADRGHLFVVQADLTRLAADALLIPCDQHLQVSGTWRPFLEPGAAAQAKEDWFAPSGLSLVDGIAVMADPTPDDPTPDQVVGLRVLVDTVGVESISDMVKQSLEAVRRAAAQAEIHGGRVRRLISMPILGVGQGRFSGQRAEVIRELVGQLLEFVATHPVDVALTLMRRADFAAAQWERQRRSDAGADCWPELTDDQVKLADRLGGLAASGGLTVFAGAGVSRPVGLPSWDALLQELSPDRTITFTKDTDYPQVAEDLNRDDLNAKVAGRLTTTKHALGHALLVGLRTPSLVTTNYDPCLENAAALIHQDPAQLRVIARQLVTGGSPWLLKLHGDVALPDTIVLTRSQYNALARDLPALRGVVQTLMLTSHLLFVGFGFADVDFLAVSEAAQKVRNLAKDAPEAAKAGTAIGLGQPDPLRRSYPELDYHYLPPDDDNASAARRLEILLDRVAWKCQVAGRGRASYLLDPDYQQDAAGHDRVLADALTNLRANGEQWKDSSGAQAVHDLLAELGWREP